MPAGGGGDDDPRPSRRCIGVRSVPRRVGRIARTTIVPRPLPVLRSTDRGEHRAQATCRRRSCGGTDERPAHRQRAHVRTSTSVPLQARRAWRRSTPPGARRRRGRRDGTGGASVHAPVRRALRGAWTGPRRGSIGHAESGVIARMRAQPSAAAAATCRRHCCSSARRQSARSTYNSTHRHTHSAPSYARSSAVVRIGFEFQTGPCENASSTVASSSSCSRPRRPPRPDGRPPTARPPVPGTPPPRPARR